MPNTPSNWMEFILNIPPAIKGVMIASLIAAMRVISDKEDTKPMRILLESLICGALSYSASYGIIAAGLDINWAIFVGGMIGYIGSATVRLIAIQSITPVWLLALSKCNRASVEKVRRPNSPPEWLLGDNLSF